MLVVDESAVDVAEDEIPECDSFGAAGARCFEVFAAAHGEKQGSDEEISGVRIDRLPSRGVVVVEETKNGS